MPGDPIRKLQLKRATIQERVMAAAASLLRSQPNLFHFTSETNQTKWNLVHHFACELHRRFPDLDYDMDVSKPNMESRRPDVIIHTRNSHDDNLLVVEVKPRRQGVRATRALREACSAPQKFVSLMIRPPP